MTLPGRSDSAGATEPTLEHLNIARQMKSYCRRHPWPGTPSTMPACRQIRQVRAVTDAELRTNLLLTFDVGYHASGWWRNADYDACWHLSISWPTPGVPGPSFEPMTKGEAGFWARLFFGDYVRWLWHEPGGNQPDAPPEFNRAHRHIEHLRLFVDRPTMQPILPRGEVYTLTRWVPDVTPPKVDR